MSDAKEDQQQKPNYYTLHFVGGSRDGTTLVVSHLGPCFIASVAKPTWHKEVYEYTMFDKKTNDVRAEFRPQDLPKKEPASEPQP